MFPLLSHMVSSSPPLPEDMFTGPCEKMVMFLNAPFRRDYANAAELLAGSGPLGALSVRQTSR